MALRDSFSRDESFWSRYGSKTITIAVSVGLLALLGLSAAGSCATLVKNTEVGIIVNNITGKISLLENGGMVLHLPFGLSSVYKIDKSQRVLSLTRAHHTKEHPQGDEVNIKTNDGSNVSMGVEVVYQIKAKEADRAYRELGKEDNIEEILRALTRSEVRSQFGGLSTLEIAEAGPRSAKLHATQNKLKEQVDPLGLEVISINAQNFRFDDEYDMIIRDRKETDQILTNQKDYQDAAVEEGKRLIAESTRDKQTAIAQLQGDLAKKLLVAEGEAVRILTKAEQQAYQSEREGEAAVQSAEQDAAAVLAEGQRKAEAMEKLFAAFEHGGEGLVKESMVKLYQGVILKAKPYSPSDRVEQYQTVPSGPAVTPPVRK
jgi:regulator of protease activity HflC (stomatin/prohibitin superfamily)